VSSFLTARQHIEYTWYRLWQRHTINDVKPNISNKTKNISGVDRVE